MSIDLVVSAYKDDLGWLETLRRHGVTIRVYDKWDQERPSAADSLPVKTRLPNVGKVDHTYCHHIADRYDDLADWTVFSTDYPFDNLSGLGMEDALVPGESVRCPWICRVRDWKKDGRLAWDTMIARPDRNGTNWADRYASGKITPAKLSFVEWARQYVGFDPSGDWPGYHPGSIYAVPRKAITYLPREFYVRLREQLSHSREPEEGHCLERLWLTIFTGKARYEIEKTAAACGP